MGMPFDALVRTTHQNLPDALAFYGIEPVSDEVLVRHKREQMRLTRASFLVTWKPWMLLGTLVLGVAAYTVDGWETGIVAAISTMLFVMGRAMYGGVRPLLGQGRWRETANVPYWVAPQPIRDVARDLLDHLPEGKLIIGKLVRDEVVLDPYLLFEWRGEQVCLGIWDLDGIVAQSHYI
jgi:hypothetical protein